MQKKWWHGKIAYQIYPKSFKDTNGDGIGDLPGIIEKIPYLKDLGIDLLWLSPIYKSPFADNGYDISDYRDIDPLFGSLEDFKKLKASADASGIGLIMDLVVNHTSDEHEWFKKACEDPFGKYGKYYIIREGKNGKEPNNLRTYFGGSVWDKLPNHDNLYYCHFFHKKQPDLNWFNPELREAVYDMMNWWLKDIGLAGFRVDAISCIGKDPNFPMFEPDGVGDGLCACFTMVSQNVDVATKYLREMNSRTFIPNDKFSVGEVVGITDDNYKDFIGDNGVLGSIFDFSARALVQNQYCFYGYKKLSVKEYRDATFKAQEKVNTIGFLAPIIENHDQPRGVSIYLPLMWQNAQGAKALATSNLCLKGIPFILQGQELGMTNTKFDNINELDDCLSKDQYKRCHEQGLDNTVIMQILNDQARDHGRTPMPWDISTHYGFSSAKPWIKLHQDSATINVEAENKDPESVLNFYKKLIAVRKDPKFLKTFTYGNFIALDNPNEYTLAYLRQSHEQTIMVIANFGTNAVDFPINEESSLLLSSGIVNFNTQDCRIKVFEGSSAIVYL